MNIKNETISKFIRNELTTVPIILNRKISNNFGKFNQRIEINELLKYIDIFLDGNDLNRYFIIHGSRGVGKTTMMYQIYDYLLNVKNIPQNQIFYFSC